MPFVSLWRIIVCDMEALFFSPIATLGANFGHGIWMGGPGRAVLLVGASEGSRTLHEFMFDISRLGVSLNGVL